MGEKKSSPLRVINSVAPIRILDNGGWTDTWFAEHGRIFNIGVYPYAEVQMEVYPFEGGDRVTIYAENFGEKYALDPEKNGTGDWDRHPLLEAAIEMMHVPREYRLQVTIYSEAPSGASTGTSAAVTVAMIGALDFLTPGRMTPHEVAYTAQSVEVDMLHQQCGIQDQLCSAYGGINFIDMFKYPHSSVSQIGLPNSIWWELERRLVLIYLGNAHSSSQVHEKVIRELEDAGPDCSKLEDLRRTAGRSRDALYAGDFEELGRAMIDNTEAQRRLNPGLICGDADGIIETARSFGALGWKVNGAGGEGGSITILCGDLSHEKRAMIRTIEEGNSYRNIPVYLSRYGVRIWEKETGHRE